MSLRWLRAANHVIALFGLALAVAVAAAPAMAEVPEPRPPGTPIVPPRRHRSAPRPTPTPAGEAPAAESGFDLTPSWFISLGFVSVDMQLDVPEDAPKPAAYEGYGAEISAGLSNGFLFGGVYADATSAPGGAQGSFGLELGALCVGLDGGVVTDGENAGLRGRAFLALGYYIFFVGRQTLDARTDTVTGFMIKLPFVLDDGRWIGLGAQ